MKKIVFAVLLLNSPGLLGQQPGALPQFSFGFFAGAEIQTLNIQAQPRQPDKPVIPSQNLTSGGASIGIWGQWPLLPVLDLRPSVQLTYLNNSIQFETADGRIRRDRYTFTDVEIPLHFLLSSRRQNLPVQALILFGGRLSWNFSAANTNTPLKLLPERFGLDIGVGAGFHLRKWHIRPELIYSYGLNNIHDFQNSPYDWAVGRLLRDRLSLRVVFEMER